MPKECETGAHPVVCARVLQRLVRHVCAALVVAPRRQVVLGGLAQLDEPRAGVRRICDTGRQMSGSARAHVRRRKQARVGCVWWMGWMGEWGKGRGTRTMGLVVRGGPHHHPRGTELFGFVGRWWVVDGGGWRGCWGVGDGEDGGKVVRGMGRGWIGPGWRAQAHTSTRTRLWPALRHWQPPALRPRRRGAAAPPRPGWAPLALGGSACS